MLDQLVEFFTFQEPNIRYVIIGTTLLGVCSALVGTFSFLRKQALVGDVIAHSLLPGLCLAFIVFDSKNILVLITGASVTGWLSVVFIDFITRNSKLKTDTATAISLTLFFAVGLLLLTYIQHNGSGAQSGIDHYLFGKAAAMIPSDITQLIVVGLILISIVLLFFKEFKIISFNREYAETIGLPVKFLEFLLSVITIITVAVGIQAVGVVLMAALLITPAAIGRFWSNRLPGLILIAIFAGIISGLSGSFVSFVAPNMPTGPWVVMTLTFFVIISIFFSPSKGFLRKWLLSRENNRKILTENILKVFYKIGEKEASFQQLITRNQLMQSQNFLEEDLVKGLSILKRKGALTLHINKWRLTEKGLISARKVVRLHRLWELYLTKRLKLMPDHVHNDAEAIEHIITPEIEAIIEKELSFPERDPHNSEIPKN